MSLYTVKTFVPVYVQIHVDDEDEEGDGPREIRVERVVVGDEEVPSTLADVIAAGGGVTDENGLEVKEVYTEGNRDIDWELIARGYMGSYGDGWPAWEFGW